MTLPPICFPLLARIYTLAGNAAKVTVEPYNMNLPRGNGVPLIE